MAARLLGATVVFGTMMPGFRCEDNGLALTPPMGWNPWNCWASDIDEVTIMAAARVMQGKLAPADFAAAVRDLGVPLSVRNMHGIAGANMDLSSDTIDYLAFISSLEPQLSEAASAPATVLMS